MKEQSDNEIRDSIIGLGEKSIRKSYYPQLQNKINEIKELNKSLEDKVKQRTEDLEKTNHELEQTVNNLKLTQSKLIESEKMASLGVLVAGVAHEINTPVGISLTGITHFLDIVKKLDSDYKSAKMTEKQFESFLDKSTELARSINLNLEKTAQLIRSFKQVAVDQTSEKKRVFNIKKYFQEILLSINNIIKNTNIQIMIRCEETLSINSYPGAFSQVFTNLIINSITHGFKNKDYSKILIDINHENNILHINYEDDGCGIIEENLHKIFDPFFTTNREQGGTGLGLNIIYNIITNTLNGDIICQSEENKGVKFKITIPIEVEKETNQTYYI